MIKLILTGNLTRDPELKTTAGGVSVCAFTVASNRRGRDGAEAVDYVNVSAWRELGEICARYLTKGKKVLVVGRAGARGYLGRDGATHASLELQADEVEFLSRKDRDAGGFVEVDPEELPDGMAE